MKRKIVKKLNKEQKQLLIAMLIGDGTISSNYVFKLSHAAEQLEFLKWKVDLLNKAGLKNNGIKEYVSTTGYNIGRTVLYSQLSINPTIKALRKSIYIPKKTITRNLLEWFDPLGIAIWYMDDGSINVNTSSQRSSIQHTIKFHTCVDKECAQMIIDYFMEKWKIKFRLFPEKNKYYSIESSSEADCKKFCELIKPYISQVPSMLYKIRRNFTKEEFINLQKNDLEMRDTIY